MDGLRTRFRMTLPGACLLCGAPSGEAGLCHACVASLPVVSSNRCPICAAPAPSATECGRCLQRRPAYDQVIVALDYLSPVDFLVADLKYSRNLAAARALAFLLAQLLEREPYPDIVLPMPIAASRLRERGFNQASEIARHACAVFGLRVSERLAQRTAANQSQTALPWRDRARNVRGAFRCETDLTGKTIAVVDDVITTGATLNELASVLKRAGAEKVIGWIAARTPPQR
jgi:ComF family protein